MGQRGSSERTHKGGQLAGALSAGHLTIAASSLSAGGAGECHNAMRMQGQPHLSQRRWGHETAPVTTSSMR